MKPLLCIICIYLFKQLCPNGPHEKNDCRLFAALLGKAAKVKSAHAERTKRGTCTKCGAWMIWMSVLGSLVFLYVFSLCLFPDFDGG